MQNDQLNEHLNKLPELVKYKILDYYLCSYAKQKNIHWPNKQSRLKDFSMYCYLDDKITNKGYVRLDPPDLKLIERKFKNIQLNPRIDENYLGRVISDCWNKLYKIAELNIWPGMGPVKRNILLAGGIFTQYQTNAFAQEFQDYHTFFNLNQDYDLFFNGNILKAYKYKRFYIMLKGYCNRFNLIIGSNNRSTEVVDDFDFDCCKIFYSFDDNQLYAHHSLILSNCETKLPSFFDIDHKPKATSNEEENLDDTASSDSSTRPFETCVCARFKRTLKYMMKGFCKEENVANELQRAREIEASIVNKVTGFSHVCSCVICGNCWDLSSQDAELYDLSDSEDSDCSCCLENDLDSDIDN